MRFMMLPRLGLCQTPVVDGDVSANVAIMAECLAEAEPAELYMFPELNLSGQVGARGRDEGQRIFHIAETIPGPLTEQVSDLALKRHAWLLVGLIEAHSKIPGIVFNTSVLFDDEGHLRLSQRKLHIPGQEKHYFTPGENVNVADTPVGPVGVAICYDPFFPETVRQLALKGASILLMPFNAPLETNDRHALTHLTCTRAIENRCFAAAVNRVGTSSSGMTYFGGSVASDPFGRIQVMSPFDEPCVRYLEVDQELTLRERGWLPTLRDRRPEIYTEITQSMQ